MDRAAVWEFMERFVDMAAGAVTLSALAVADRCGLLATLGDSTPRTANQLADVAGLDLRYTEEILRQLTAAGITDYDPGAETFVLPAERATVVADDASPYAMTGWLDMLPTAASFVDRVADAARHGGGVPAEAYPDRMVQAVDRANGPSMRILLTRRWLPTMPDVVARLEKGARVADVGCGSGAAAIAMATAYPNSTVVAYDVDPRAIAVAARRGAEIENVEFVVMGAEEIPTDPPFDLITAFDVVHDLPNPDGALARIRAALGDDGVFLMMEPALSSELEENRNARSALFYGVSLMYCMTQSLAAGGAGLGAGWGAGRAEALCRSAGFSRFERLPIDNPFSAFFRVGP